MRINGGKFEQKTGECWSLWRWWMATKNGMVYPITWDWMVSTYPAYLKTCSHRTRVRSKYVWDPKMSCLYTLYTNSSFQKKQWKHKTTIYTIIFHVSKFTTFRFCHNYDLQLLWCQPVKTRFLPKRHFDSTLSSSTVEGCHKLRRLTKQIVRIRLSLLAPSRVVKCLCICHYKMNLAKLMYWVFDLCGFVMLNVRSLWFCNA